jgi:heme a synthase
VSWRLLRPLTVATLVSNVAIVVTGGAVRLTGSGLGCPTWPRCTRDSFVAHGELGLHGAIEFGNRLMTFVLAAIAVATWVAAMRARPRRRPVRVLATALALGIPGQAVIGGVTVLTDLNPWVVALHLMLSMAMIALAVLLVGEVYTGPVVGRGSAPRVPPMLRRAAYGVLAVTFVVLYLGTMVTGAGPHAGHLEATDLDGDRVQLVRNGLDAQVASHVHAALVYVLVGLTVVTLALAARQRAAPVRSAAAALLTVEVAQGAVGFAQYFNDLPVLLVGVHLLGAALLTAAAAWLATTTRGPHPDSAAAPRAVSGARPQTSRAQTSSGSTATARNSSAR